MGNVDNTADADKPISTATQSELNTKMPLAGGTFTGNVAFADGTKIEFPTFDIYNDDGLAIIEGTYGLRVDTTSGLGAVLKTVNGIEKILTDKDVKSTYSATGTDPVNGTAVASAISTKQDNLTTSQLDAVNSGIDSAKVAQISTNKTDISTINGKIPSQASSTNQLADKNFVNSSIASNTANFIGTFNSVAELEAYSGPVTNNDYAFVVGTDEQGNTVYDRYKYTTATTPAGWVFEYELNNSSFTAVQWAALNSGATSTNIGQIATNTSDISTLQTSKQDVISDLATIRSGAALGTTAVQPSDLATVATSGSYNDLQDKPTIPTVNNATITLTQGGVTKGSFSLNQSNNDTIDFDAGADNAYTTDNLVSGTNIEIVKDSAMSISEHTVALYHFDNSLENAIQNSPIQLTFSGTPSYYTSVNSDFKTGIGGSGDITLPSFSSLSSLTIDFWFKTVSGGNSVFQLYGAVDCRESNSTFRFVDSWGNLLFPAVPFSWQTWYHYAITKSGTTCKHFLNGKLIGTSQMSSSYIYGGVLYKQYAYVDEFRVSNKVLWESDFTPPSAPYSDKEVYAINNTQDISGKLDITTAASTYVPLTQKGVANGVATLDSNGKVPTSQIPAPTLTWYTGNRGSTVTIPSTASANLVKVYKNGVLLQPTEDYSISGTTLTLVTEIYETDKICLEVF